MRKKMLPGGQLGETLAKAVALNGQQRLKALVVVYESERDDKGLAYTFSAGPGVTHRMDFVGCMANAAACAQRWNDETNPGEES
jgi:hypothetical protein